MNVRYEIVPDGDAWAVLQIGTTQDKTVKPHLKRLMAHNIALGDAFALVKFFSSVNIRHVANRH